ncbi:MAG: AraC family transcriptional regulator [Clostridium sp.]|nr:AraC family transcriptional regulator [Clostridium sp.]
MYDPIIRELFPDRKSILSEQRFSSFDTDIPKDDSSKKIYVTAHDIAYAAAHDVTPAAAYAVASPFGNDPDSMKYNINYLQGDFDLSYTLSHYGKTFSPSSFVRKNFLYLQMLCSATFSKDHYTKRKDLPSYWLAQTFWGKGVLHYNQKAYELVPGDVVLLDCRLPHEYYAASDEGWGYRFLHFDGISMPAYYSQITSGQNVKFTFCENSRFEALFKEMLVINSGSELNRDIITNRIIIDMITEILCQCPQYQEAEMPPVIIDLCNYLQNSFREKLTLDQIAGEVNLSKYYMSREFKKYTGTTIFSYILDCRIALAQQLLRQSNMPIGEIAEYVGFEDHNSFYRFFQQRENLSPSAYRKYWNAF